MSHYSTSRKTVSARACLMKHTINTIIVCVTPAFRPASLHGSSRWSHPSQDVPGGPQWIFWHQSRTLEQPNPGLEDLQQHLRPQPSTVHLSPAETKEKQLLRWVEGTWRPLQMWRSRVHGYSSGDDHEGTVNILAALIKEQ